MFNQKERLRHFALAVFLMFGLGVALNSYADGKNDDDDGHGGPVGTWVLDIEFPAVPGAPPPPPPFKELLTFHKGGTVSESNTLLNENSYNPAFGMGCGFTGPGGAPELGCNASDGQGVWRRSGHSSVAFVFMKLVFDGATNAHVGYLRVTSHRLDIGEDELSQDPAFTLTEFLIGTDIDTAVAIASS